jgi:hypothetical protein
MAKRRKTKIARIRRRRSSMGFLGKKSSMMPLLATVMVQLFGPKLAEKLNMVGKEKILVGALQAGLSFSPVKGLKKSEILLGAGVANIAEAVKEMGVIPGLSGWEADLPMLSGYETGTMSRQIGLYS